MGNKKRLGKLSRTLWVLASANGSLLAEKNPNPGMPPYHLDAMTDHIPALVAAPNKITLHNVRREWNNAVRRNCLGLSYPARRLVHISNLVQERKVTITIEEAT